MVLDGFTGSSGVFVDVFDFFVVCFDVFHFFFVGGSFCFFMDVVSLLSIAS